MLSKLFCIVKINILKKRTKFKIKKNKTFIKALNILIKKNIVINYFFIKNDYILIYVNLTFIDLLKNINLKYINKKRFKKKKLPNYKFF